MNQIFKITFLALALSSGAFAAPDVIQSDLNVPIIQLNPVGITPVDVQSAVIPAVTPLPVNPFSGRGQENEVMQQQLESYILKNKILKEQVEIGKLKLELDKTIVDARGTSPNIGIGANTLPSPNATMDEAMVAAGLPKIPKRKKKVVIELPPPPPPIVMPTLSVVGISTIAGKKTASVSCDGIYSSVSVNTQVCGKTITSIETKFIIADGQRFEINKSPVKILSLAGTTGTTNTIQSAMQQIENPMGGLGNEPFPNQGMPQGMPQQEGVPYGGQQAVQMPPTFNQQ